MAPMRAVSWWGSTVERLPLLQSSLLETSFSSNLCPTTRPTEQASLSDTRSLRQVGDSYLLQNSNIFHIHVGNIFILYSTFKNCYLAYFTSAISNCACCYSRMEEIISPLFFLTKRKGDAAE